jgi:hypothetical protein
MFPAFYLTIGVELGTTFRELAYNEKQYIRWCPLNCNLYFKENGNEF